MSENTGAFDIMMNVLSDLGRPLTRMGELTKCNYCSYIEMKRTAEKRGAHVILRADNDVGSWIAAKYSDRDKPSRYFLELTDHCVC